MNPLENDTSQQKLCRQTGRSVEQTDSPLDAGGMAPFPSTCSVLSHCDPYGGSVVGRPATELTATFRYRQNAKGISVQWNVSAH